MAVKKGIISCSNCGQSSDLKWCTEKNLTTGKTNSWLEDSDGFAHWTFDYGDRRTFKCEWKRQYRYNVVLDYCGYNKLYTIKAVREITGWGIRDAKDAVEATPKTILFGVLKDTANRKVEWLEGVGASAHAELVGQELKDEEKVEMTTQVQTDTGLESSVHNFFEQETTKAVNRISGAADSIVSQIEQLPEAVRFEIQKQLPVEHVITVNVGETVRHMVGHPHVKLGTLITVASQRTPAGEKLNMLMVGPAGGGKTTLGRQLAEAMGLRFFEASMGPATTEDDLVGYRSPDGKYVPGIMREPYENGGVLMLDELDNSNPMVLTSLNSAMSNGHCTFPDAEIARHTDFIMIAAGNTYGRGADRVYVGRQQLDGATLDRFVVTNLDYDEDAELDWTGRDQEEWVKYVQRVRAEIFKHKMQYIVSPRASIFGATLLRAGMDVDEMQEMVLFKGMDLDARSRIISNVGKFDGITSLHRY